MTQYRVRWKFELAANVRRSVVLVRDSDWPCPVEPSDMPSALAILRRDIGSQTSITYIGCQTEFVLRSIKIVCIGGGMSRVPIVLSPDFQPLRLHMRRSLTVHAAQEARAQQVECGR